MLTPVRSADDETACVIDKDCGHHHANETEFAPGVKSEARGKQETITRPHPVQRLSAEPVMKEEKSVVNSEHQGQEEKQEYDRAEDHSRDRKGE